MLRTKKRVFILLLFAVIMGMALLLGLQSFMPSLVVHASNEHVHCFCGSALCNEDSHNDALVWTAWDAKSDLTVDGNYYLANNVEADELTKDIVVSKNVNLCLCGKTLHLGTYGLVVAKGATLTISDCVGNGTIAACRDDDTNPVIGSIELSGKLNVYGGTITHSKNDNYISQYHCAINVAAAGELNVFGGTITGEKSLSINNLGTVVIDGGVLTSSVYNGLTYQRRRSDPIKQTTVNPATVTLKSGEINYSNAVVNAGTLNVEGGSISASTGNAVILNFVGALNVSGGTIRSEKNTCVIMKSASSVLPSGTITVSGGTVTTSAYGSSTYSCYAIDGRNLHISGGTISNTNQDATYAINLVGALYLSGSPSITTVNSSAHHILYTGTDIYANDGKSNPTYYEGEALKLQTTRSISSKLYQPVVYGLKDEAQGEKFILDNYENYRLKYENNQLILLPEHPHCIGACNTCTDSTHAVNSDNGFSYTYMHIKDNEINFTNYTYENYLPYEDYHSGGNFERFLACDVNTTSEKNRTSGTSFLCLNGYDVDGQNLETVSQDGILVVTDCTGEGSMKGVIIANGGTLRVYNGRIGEITVQDGANLLLFGGIYAQKLENATLPAGYGWVQNNDSETKNEYPYTITAVTAYTVEHYFENLAGEFILDVNKTQRLYDAAASTVTATHLTCAGFEADLDNAESFNSSTILPDGSLVLKLYYVRTTHTVTVTINDPLFGEVDNPVIQNVKYGTPITISGNVVTVGTQTVTVTPTAQTATNSYYFVNITGGNTTVDGDETLTANFITRSRVYKPSLDGTNFIYDGTEKTYNIPANDGYTVQGNKQTETGVYQVTVSLVDKDGSEWEDGTNTDLSYEFIIKVGAQSFVDENSTDNTKPSVIVTSPMGIAPDISLVVVDKTEDEAVIEKLPSNKNLVVEKIYDISLERNGDNVQVSEVGGLITIKILIDETLKADNIKLYHIHGEEDGVEIKRGRAGVVNEYVIEGDYAIITIDRLSEFAFVTEKANNFWWVWLIAAVVIVAIVTVALVINIKKSKARKEALCTGNSPASCKEQNTEEKD